MSKNTVITELETKVQSTVSLIHHLKQDNKRLAADYSALKDKLDGYESKISQLEDLINEAEREHKQLEKSVVSALSNLDDVDEIRAESARTTGSLRSRSKRNDENLIFSDGEDKDDADTVQLDEPDGVDTNENLGLEIF